MLAGPLQGNLFADRHRHGTESLCLTRSKPMAGAKSVHKLGVALELIIGYGDHQKTGATSGQEEGLAI
jgi:hypothetical protein